MGNVTEDENNITDQEVLFTTGLRTHQKILILTLNIPLSITAFLGNVLIIVALQKVPSIHPPSKLLLACLASTDLCVGLITQPLNIALTMSPKNATHYRHLVITFNTKGSIFCGVSLLTLTAVSVDRVLALLLGLRYRQVVTLKKVQLVVVTFWLFSAAVAMTVFFNLLIARSIACIVLLLCIVISTFCYMKIYLTLRHHQTQVQDHVHQGQQVGEQIPLNIARYRKTVSSALWIQMTLLACYFPYGIFVGIIAVTGSPKSSLDIVWAITISLLLLNSSLNPFLYCWKMREVRQAVEETIRQFCCFLS